MGRGESENLIDLTKANELDDLFKLKTFVAGEKLTEYGSKTGELLKNSIPAAVKEDISLESFKENNWKELRECLIELKKRDRGEQIPLAPNRPADNDEVRVIIPDVHGNARNLYRSLLSVGAIDREGNKKEGYWVCQLGDLIHGGADVFAADNETSLLASGWVDCQLIGNHDLPFISGNKREFGFATMHENLYPGLEPRLNRGLRLGQWSAAVSVDDWLISHAGLTANNLGMLRKQHDCNLSNYEQMADAINDIFIDSLIKRDPENFLNRVGELRGGWAPEGGIFWADWKELTDSYGNKNLTRQIVGHTAQKTPPKCINDCLWNIDRSGVGERTGSFSVLIKPPKDGGWLPVSIDRAERGEIS